jgi:hypothetical protein
VDEATRRRTEELDRPGRQNTHGPIELAEELLDLIGRAVGESSNAPGTEKGFLERCYREALEQHRRIRRDNP